LAHYESTANIDRFCFVVKSCLKEDGSLFIIGEEERLRKALKDNGLFVRRRYGVKHTENQPITRVLIEAK